MTNIIGIKLWMFYFLAYLLNLSYSTAPFNTTEVDLIQNYFLQNIGPQNTYTGCVIASPSNSNPDYYYHWQRDAAITMQTLITAFNSSDFDMRFQNYVQWVQHVQNLQDTNGINILGEPKFNTDGTLFTGGWCRPQNDGPASRALAQIMYANWLIENNRKNYVIENLYIINNSNIKDNLNCNVANQNKIDCGYLGINEQQCEQKNCCWQEINPNPNNYPWCFYANTNPSSSGTIPTDLNYVSLQWQSNNNCDLWEEVRGIHFYTLMVQHYALLKGAELANLLGDSTSATSWINTANSMISTIQSFENNGIIQDDQRTYDCSVILASLYGGPNSTYNVYPPTSSAILNSAQTYINYWEQTYQVNKNDDNLGLGGTLIGRYESDSYSGCSSNGGSKGHAWFLCSNALADLWYRNGEMIINNINNIDHFITSQHLNIYAEIIKKTKPFSSQKLKQYSLDWNNKNLKEKQEISLWTASLLVSSGDEQLERVHYHCQSCNVHMSEQICETSGVEVGAVDLTWSYGTFLRAWKSRSDLMNGIDLDSLPLREIPFNSDNLKLSQKYNYDTCLEGCNGQCVD